MKGLVPANSLPVSHSSASPLSAQNPDHSRYVVKNRPMF